jgi:hypothetical protein
MLHAFKRRMKKEGSTKFTGYESIAKQFRCNNQDAVALLRNAGHNIPEGRRRILLDHAEKAAQQFREAERWQCLPGSGAGPSLDAINLDEACSLDRPAEGTMSDEEEGNVKSAATNASLSQDMSDTDDEATVAFGTSDAEQDEDQKPPAKASSTPQENAMTREGGKPPADASLPQKNANDQGKQVAAPTIGRSSKSLPKSDKKANACNKKAVASKKKSAPMKPRIKTSVLTRTTKVLDFAQFVAVRRAGRISSRLSSLLLPHRQEMMTKRRTTCLNKSIKSKRMTATTLQATSTTDPRIS